MATKKLRVRHKKRTYRQRRSQRRVGGAWGSFNMPNMPNMGTLKTLVQEKAANAGNYISQKMEEAKQAAEDLAVNVIRPNIAEYREKVINKLQDKLNEVNNKPQDQLGKIDNKLKTFLPTLIKIIETNKKEQIDTPTGGRSKRTTRRKIQKGGFGALLVMLFTKEGRDKIINELNSDPEMFNMILGVIVGIFGENSPVSTFIRNFLIKEVPQQ